ncbi:MAG: zinc-binding dehydrogenase [Candidatus Tectimicrobiota bacterium]
MRAAVFEGIRTIQMHTLPDPTPQPEDVVLRVRHCGICGSDLHSYTSGAFIQPGQVMGHEFCGEVVAVGARVQGLRPGQRVTAMPFQACYACQACVRGDTHLCYHVAGQAIAYGLPGAFAEFVRIPGATLERNVFVLPDAVSDLAGAMVEPLAVAVHAVRLANPELGARVVVLGAGLIGQCLIQVLRARGVGLIVASEVSDRRAALARRSGADVTVNPLLGNVVEQVGEVLGFVPGRRSAAADVVFDCAGVPAAFAQGVRLVRPGGTLTITALYEEQVQCDLSRLVWSEVKLLGTFGYRNEFPQAIALLHSGKVQLEHLVTQVFPLEQTGAGFERQLARDEVMKVMIQP